jgi:tRNA nucleotidyltransferase (CCA-adding enzyme)
VELRDPLSIATSSAAIVEVLERGDAFRRPDRFEWLLQAYEVSRQATAKRFRLAMKAAGAVDAGALAALHRDDPGEIPKAVRQARVVAVGRALYGDDALEQPRE